MKIMVCGKGGSGKSTVTALMAKEYERQGKRVLVIDCDESNYGLHQQLGMEFPKDFTDYVGGKQKIMMLSANGPMNMPPLFDRRISFEDIPAEYLLRQTGLTPLQQSRYLQKNWFLAAVQ